MTKLLPLVLASLWRKPTRTLLTTLSLVTAFLLFGVLEPIAQLFEGGTTRATHRLIVSPRHSISDMLPVRYAETVRGIEGVELVAHQTWFGGMFRDPANNFTRLAVSAESWLDAYADRIVLPEDQRRAFVDTPSGAIAGRATADKYNLRVGDTLPLIADIWHNRDGSEWAFDLVGIFDGADENVDTTRVLLNFTYFDEYRIVAPGYVSNLIATLEPGAEPASVIRAIDATFVNSEMETRTVSEQEFLLRMMRQYGNVALIVRGVLAAVFFTIALLAANTMAQATRERTTELAVLKTLGFPESRILALVLSESILIPLAAALNGLVLARIVLSYTDGLTAFPATLRVGLQTVGTALVLAIAIGIIAGWPPARRAAKLDIATALRTR